MQNINSLFFGDTWRQPESPKKKMSLDQIKGYKLARIVKGKKWYINYCIFENGEWKRYKKHYALNNIEDPLAKEKEFLKKRDEINSYLEKNIQQSKIETDIISKKRKELPKVFNQIGIEIPRTVLGFLSYHISVLKSREKFGTMNHYSSLKNILTAFNLSDKIEFKDVNSVLLDSLETYLLNRKHNGNNLRGNTINTHFRHFRTLFNKAIKNKVARQSDFPFKNSMNINGFSFSHHKNPISVRCLTKDELELVKNYQGQYVYSKRVFMYLYYCFGMYISDAAKLTYSNIKSNSIQYQRVKTSGAIPPIVINAKIKSLLESFDNDGHYLLDILNKSRHKTIKQQRDRINRVKKKVNYGLKQIAIELNIDKPLTTRVARHTFANLIRKKGYSIYQIMHFLGHSEVETTQGYLDSIDNAEYEDIGMDL